MTANMGIRQLTVFAANFSLRFHELLPFTHLEQIHQVIAAILMVAAAGSCILLLLLLDRQMQWPWMHWQRRHKAVLTLSLHWRGHWVNMRNRRASYPGRAIHYECIMFMV